MEEPSRPTTGPIDVDALAKAVADLGIDVPRDRIELLDRYRAALWEWNSRLNLTRHITLEKFASRDVLDTWQLAEQIAPKRRVLDIGSGGGVPGLVLAICRPDLRVTVTESTQKKARVLEAIVRELSLPVEAFGCRAEEVLATRTYDVVTARGVAPLAKILTWLRPHWNAFDELLLVKGRNWGDERGEARHQGLMKNLELRKAATYSMPGIEGGESVILRIRRKDFEEDE